MPRDRDLAATLRDVDDAVKRRRAAAVDDELVTRVRRISGREAVDVDEPGIDLAGRNDKRVDLRSAAERDRRGDDVAVQGKRRTGRVGILGDDVDREVDRAQREQRRVGIKHHVVARIGPEARDVDVAGEEQVFVAAGKIAGVEGDVAGRRVAGRGVNRRDRQRAVHFGYVGDAARANCERAGAVAVEVGVDLECVAAANRDRGAGGGAGGQGDVAADDVARDERAVGSRVDHRALVDAEVNVAVA